MSDWRELVDAADDGALGDPDKGTGSDWKGGEYHSEGSDPDRKLFDPPIVRHSSKRPSYRQWLNILATQRNVFLLTHSGWLWDHEKLMPYVLDKTPARELKEISDREKWPVEVVDTLTKLRKKYSLMKAFARLILDGGPEAVWVGKPLDPKSVHSDVTAFYAAGRSGISGDMVEGSSLCWEVYDAYHIPTSTFETIARMLELEETERSTVTVVKPDLSSGDPGVMARAFDEAMESVGDALGIDGDPDETVAAHDRRGRRIEEAILRNADEAMVESMGTREYRDSGVNPAMPPRVRCTYMRKTKRFGEWQCSHWSVHGSDRCEAHGGDLVSLEETKALLKTSQQKIFGASLAAVGTIVDLMTHSASDQIRLRAAETLLNRAGLNEQQDLSVTLGINDDMATAKPAGDIVRERLMNLAGLSPQEVTAAKKREEEDMGRFEAIDAEVVEEDEVIMPDAHSDD